jgi:two-component system response regulator AtoC
VFRVSGTDRRRVLREARVLAMRETRGSAGRTVLVVDDEDLIRWSVRQRLEEEGYRVVDAVDAHGALERAAGADLVVVDRRLPDADGLAVAATLHRRRPARPVIVMTAFGGPELEDEARMAGVDAVVQKPFELSALVALIASELGSGES